MEQSATFKDLVITNIQGVPLIKQATVDSQINVSHLNPGLYIISALGKENQAFKSMFIKLDDWFQFIISVLFLS